MTDELAGKVAIVTGGASGLGEGLARRFAAEGAKVLIADVDRDGGAALAADIGANALFVETDVSDIDQVSGLVTTAVDHFGGLHVMANNAGVSGTMHFRLLDDDLADFHKVMSVNLLAVMAGTRDAARHMKDNGGGSIINVTSIGGILAGGGVMTYRASKAAVIQFTKSAAIELAHYEIRVNAIAPGNIRTGIVRKSATGKTWRSWRSSKRRSVSRCATIVLLSGRAPWRMSPKRRSTSPPIARGTSRALFFRSTEAPSPAR